MLTAHVRYAFNPRQGDRSIARYHAVLNQPLSTGRLSRKTGDALCKPRNKFWGLYQGNGAAEINCPRCLDLMGRLGVTIVNDSTGEK